MGSLYHCRTASKSAGADTVLLVYREFSSSNLVTTVARPESSRALLLEQRNQFRRRSTLLLFRLRLHLRQHVQRALLRLLRRVRHRLKIQLQRSFTRQKTLVESQSAVRVRNLSQTVDADELALPTIDFLPASGLTPWTL